MIGKAIEREKRRLRQSLPIYGYKSEICRMVGNNRWTLLIGATGSGKSTQTGQYLVEHALTLGKIKILVTQPRRLAASSLASYVRKEWKNDSDIGYSGARNLAKSKGIKNGKLIFITTFQLLDILKKILI